MVMIAFGRMSRLEAFLFGAHPVDGATIPEENTLSYGSAIIPTQARGNV